MNSARRLLWGIIVLGTIIVVGVIGYMTIEGWSFLDSLFMTVETITTVGYNEVLPLSSGGQVFTIFLIISGVGGALYTLTGIIRYFIEGNLGTTLGRRRMENRISKLKGHFILCGFGRVGESVASTFHEEGVPFVVIDNKPSRIEHLEQSEYLYLEGDATRDEVLKEAGVERARGLVATLGSDADNTYITLSGRALNPEMFIESRASSEQAETKLKNAGADRVVAPYRIGARRMAMLAMRPKVVDFIDTIIRHRGPELQMENVAIENGSTLAGQTVNELRQC